MAFYAILINGQGIRMPGSEAAKPIVGFYTSRTIWALDEERARERALRSVRKLWVAGEYARSNEGASPQLTVDSCKRVGLRAWLVAPNKGHSFYPEEEHAA